MTRPTGWRPTAFYWPNGGNQAYTAAAQLISPEQPAQHVEDPIDNGGIPVVAWVPFRDAQVELDGHALAWTDKAVQVQVMMRADAKHTVWVWASAVRRGR